MSSPVGTELKRSKYRLLGLVGQGQFGRVFCAVHRRTGRLVALKNLEHQRFPTHKFLRELRILLSLQHPNIVTCYALEHTRTGRYLVMDYCEGGTLRNLMDDECRLNIAQGFQLITDVLAGLDHAHSRGIVHCDIKPDNILLNVQATGWTARISDFGIARLTQELVGQDGLGNTGSPAYMAPERFYGQYSHSSDLYAVGVLLFEMLAGYRPFSGTPAELMSGHLNQPVKLPDSIPEVWQPILTTALQKLPARRFRSASEMLVALRTVGAIAGYTPWSSSSPIHLPLLQPISSLEVHPSISQRQERLTQAIAHLALVPPVANAEGVGLCQASDRQFAFDAVVTASVTGNVTQPIPRLQTELPVPIQALISRSQGCFAITQNAVTLLSPPTPTNEQVGELLKTNIVTTEERLILADVERQGRWLAIVTQSKVGGLLSFKGLETGGRSPGSLAPRPIPLLNQQQPDRWLRLIALDASHVAVVAVVTEEATAQRRGRAPHQSTVFEVFTRRGERLELLRVPLCLRQVRATVTPYRLIATDEYDPYALVIIDLKPFRILRFGVEITPQFLESTTWGYVLMDADGQVVLLDSYGQRISRIEGPKNPRAIATFNNHGLVVTTWDGATGDLHVIDLRELGIDLLF